MNENKKSYIGIIIIAILFVVALVTALLAGIAIGIVIADTKEEANSIIEIETMVAVVEPTEESLSLERGSLGDVRSRLEKHNYAAAVAYLDYTSVSFDELKVSFNNGLIYDYPFLKDVTRDRFVSLSGGEVYLFVPKSQNAQVQVCERYINDSGEVAVSEPIYKSNTGDPFIVRGNVSDIFSNLIVKVKNPGEDWVSCSPSISLRDGSVIIGDDMMDITVDEYLFNY